MPRTSARSFPSFWTLHLAGWIALGLSMWIGVLAHVESPGRAFVGKMIFAGIGGIFALGLRPLYRHLHERGLSIARLIIVSAVCSYAFSFVWSIAYKGSVYLLWDWVDGQPLEIPSFSYLISGMLFFTFIPMAWSVLYFGIKYYQDVQAERERALAAEGLAHEARLQALRYQINPHFLFNTLNAISTLVVEHKNRDAERMIARLSDFLRLTLESDGTPEVPLAEELAFIRQYLDIQQIRFGDRLEVTYDVDAQALSAHVPPLLLQPLVENAVRHAIVPREAGGHLAIEARRVADRLHLRLTDDGPGPPDADALAQSSGVGLANVQSRLEALYGPDHTFQIARADGGGCAISIALPYRTEAEPAPSATPPSLAASPDLSAAR